MITIRFEVVKCKRQQMVHCPKCQKRRRLTFSAQQTVNPFNKNSAGIPKSYNEVVDSVRSELSLLVSKATHDGVLYRNCPPTP